MLVQARRSALLPPPFGAGMNSGNHKIGQAAGANRLVYRIVPQKTGTIWDVWIETRARSGPNCSPQLTDTDAAESSSYSGGNPNNWLWEVRFHPVNADGTFDPATNIVPAKQFNPYFQRRQTSLEYGSVLTLSALKIPAGSVANPFNVTAGVPFAMTIAPVNGAPATDYASCNQIYTDDGLEGAQDRNEILATARDTFYGLDGRTIMGGSNAAGTSQWYPGNNFNTAPFTKHLPVYLLVYTDGTREGQPYFSCASQSAPTVAATQYTMNYKVPAAATFTHLGAVCASAVAGSVTATLTVNGTDRATITITSTGAYPDRVKRVRLPAPVSVIPSDTIVVTFTTTVDNVVARIYSNGVFTSLLGQGSSDNFWLTGDTLRVVPIYPLPWPYPRLVAGSTPHGAPSTPTSLTATGGSGTVSLAWTAPPEAWVNAYNIYRDGSLLTTVATNSYSDTAVTGGTTYSYTVQSVGLDGRTSGQTGAQTATPTTPATIAYVGARGTLITGGTTGATTQVVPVSAAVATGNKLVVVAAGRSSAAVLNTVTDSKSNTYVISKQLQDAGGNHSIAIAIGQIATPLTTSDTVTLTYAAAIGPSRSAELHEFSGLLASSATDQTASAVAGSTSTTVTTPATPATTQAAEVAIGAWVTATADTAITGTNGYTALGGVLKSSGATSGDRAVFAVYKILAATGAQTATGTVDVAASAAAVIATLKGA